MSIHNKKNSIQLPFTQLWYNFTKQCQKENKAIAKINRQLKNKNGQHLCSKSMHEENILHQKRQSLNCNPKRLSQLTEQNVTIAHLIKNKQKQNYIQNDIKLQQDSNNQASTRQHRSVIVDRSRGDNCCNNSLISDKSKSKISDKILKIIQSNVIPFLVDKFIQIEEKTSTKFKKLQSVINKQKSEIQSLKANQKQLQQSVLQLNKKIQRIENQKYCKQKTCQCKTLVEVGNSPVSFQEDPAFQKQSTFQQFSNRRITLQQHQLNLRQISHLLEELTSTLEQSGIRNEEKVGQLQKQMKKITEKQRIGQEKLEKQFAQKILQLISTYNDNFVDLDKRMSKIEDVIEPASESERVITMPANRLVEPQKFKQNKTSY